MAASVFAIPTAEMGRRKGHPDRARQSWFSARRLDPSLVSVFSLLLPTSLDLAWGVASHILLQPLSSQLSSMGKIVSD